MIAVKHGHQLRLVHSLGPLLMGQAMNHFPDKIDLNSYTIYSTNPVPDTEMKKY